MQVCVGLPDAVPGTDGRLLVEWARRAEGGPFSTVAVLDRLPALSSFPAEGAEALAGLLSVHGLEREAAVVEEWLEGRAD